MQIVQMLQMAGRKDPLQSHVRFPAGSSFAYGTPMYASTQGRHAAPRGKPKGIRET
ncbi:MAG TPA: hypothetical protein GX730_08005 [Chloroflexi bacterium]|nr:hypothetical protein [Chloroflexota bacterium]